MEKGKGVGPCVVWLWGGRSGERCVTLVGIWNCLPGYFLLISFVRSSYHFSFPSPFFLVLFDLFLAFLRFRDSFQLPWFRSHSDPASCLPLARYGRVKAKRPRNQSIRVSLLSSLLSQFFDFRNPKEGPILFCSEPSQPGKIS